MSNTDCGKQGGSGLSPAEVLTEAISQIYQKRMTTTSGGNFSLPDENDSESLWITPAGKDKGRLVAGDMVRVQSDGDFDGECRPSSEFPIHRSIYQRRPDVKAVIHAHPPALVAYALARKSPDLRVLPQIRQFCGPVGYADYRLPGSEVLGDVIAKEFERGANVVVMENHGVAVAGGSMAEALQRLDAAEFTAKVILDAASLGGAQVVENSMDGSIAPVRRPEVMVVADDGHRTPSPDGIGEELAQWVQRACDQGLMTGIYGSVSKRVAGQDFVISPSGMSRPGVLAEEFIWMCGTAMVGNRASLPSPDWGIHEQIYRIHPDVNSIIITQSPALMAHAVARQPLDVSTNPESWVFIREVAQVSYGAQIDIEVATQGICPPVYPLAVCRT